MNIFVKVYGISWNITLFILPDILLIPGYKTALLNKTAFNLINHWLQA
jgi:hypothetical protein